MASLIDRYVADLLDYAQSNDVMEDYYHHALALVGKTEVRDSKAGAKAGKDLPEDLSSFLKLLEPADAQAVLSKFIEISCAQLGILEVNVSSATLLSETQRNEIKNKLAGVFNRRISMITKVDASLLGGLRVVAGDTVIDNSIKKRLADMKKSVYKGVYSK